MTLICTAYGGSDERPAIDAGLVPLTPAFMEILKARQQLTQRLLGAAGAETLDSLLFHESSPQWLSWSEALDEMLQAAEATGWALVDDHRLASAGLGSGTCQPPAVRTDCDFMQVWPERFQFTCRLRNTDTALESTMLYFDEFYTAAGQATPAAPGRHAA